MTPREARTAIIHLAAEMARCENMPSEYAEDHRWFLSTPRAERLRVVSLAARANDQCRRWAQQLNQICKSLGAANG